MVLGSYSILISSSIVAKFIMDKAGITNYIYTTWCDWIDGVWKDRTDTDRAEALIHAGEEINDDTDLEKILTIGHKDNGTPIKVNMNIDSHMLIVGLSNCGKSKLAEKCLQGKKSITILNAFETDFKSLQGNFINSNENILQYLENCLKGRAECSEVHYVLIDELLVLMRDKKIEKALSELLATARHFNLYIIGLTQEGTKEVLKCKNLFNVRVCMKQLEESAIRTVLGCSIPAEDRALQQREFYVVDNNGLRRGISYDL